MSDEVTEESKALAREHGIEVQPDPTSNDLASSHDLAIEDMDHYAYIRVRNDLKKRKDFGLAKYGTILQAGNGRDSIADAYDETLDQIVYLRTRISEYESGAGYVPHWLLKCYEKAQSIAIVLSTVIQEKEEQLNEN